MTTAFYSRPNSTNYCHYRFKIQVSHSEKLPLGGPKKYFLYTYNLDLGNNYPQQYPITHKIVSDYPITQNYPKLHKMTNITHEYQFF